VKTAWAAFLALSISGCSAPSPPKVSVLSSELVASNAKDLVIRVHLSATNVNSMAMTLSKVSAKLSVSQKPVTEVQVPYAINLPVNKAVPVDTDVTLPKQAVDQMRADAQKVTSVPYKVEGSVAVTAAGVTVTVPFDQAGTVTRDTLLQRLKSIPPG
jgi:hypothetical protein